MVAFRFYFDFGSPNAYLAHKVLPEIETRTGVKAIYVPVLLGGIFKLTGNQSPVMAFAGIKNKWAYEQLEVERFRLRHNLLNFRYNPHFPVNTLAIMRIAHAAAQQGLLPAYVNAMFEAMWERELNMADPAVIKDVLDQAGLPAADLLAAAQTDPVKTALLKATEQAVETGVFGSPSFHVGTELYFGKDRLDLVEAEIIAQKAKP
jgi:2-hydroxychromene-2-carboxylate isomerase